MSPAPDDMLDYWRKMVQPPPDGTPQLDARLHPVLQGVWEAMRAQGTPQPAEITDFLPTLVQPDATLGTQPGSRLEASRNWSGARVSPVNAKRFNLASGCWSVPELTPHPAPHSSGLPRRCSIWIGFGAHRSWSRALPQVGTVHTEASPDTHRPFIQWWIRNNPRSGALILDQPRMQPGDRIMVMLWLLSPGQAAFFIMNYSTRQPPVAGMMQSPDPGVTTAGVSVEWIVERPRDPTSHLRHPLPQFGSVRFTNCAAGTAFRPERLLSAGHLHRMVEVFDHPQRRQCLAMPRRHGEPHGGLEVRQL